MRICARAIMLLTPLVCLAAVPAAAGTPNRYDCDIQGLRHTISVDTAKRVVTETSEHRAGDAGPETWENGAYWDTHSHVQVHIAKSAVSWGPIDDESGIWLFWRSIDTAASTYKDFDQRTGTCRREQ